jgi:hypothetical protein
LVGTLRLSLDLSGHRILRHLIRSMNPIPEQIIVQFGVGHVDPCCRPAF